MNWKQKLGSRKLWCAVAAWLTTLLTSFGVADSTVTQIALIVSGVGALVAYIIAQAAVDKECEKQKKEDISCG